MGPDVLVAESDAWIPILGLRNADRQSIQSPHGQLTGDVMAAASCLIRSRWPKIAGLLNPSLLKDRNVHVKEEETFVQIFHESGCDHWILLSNYPEGLTVFDSHPPKMSSSLLRDITSFLRLECSSITLQYANVAHQKSAHDCGLYTIAYAVAIATQTNPVNCLFSATKLRQHLIRCFDEKKMLPFPIDSSRKVRNLSIRCFRTDLICDCRTPYFSIDLSIMCDHCSKWYHANCLGLSDADFAKAAKQPNFFCSHCHL